MGQLLKKICGNDLNNREEREIFDAVQGVMRLPKNMRRVRRFLDFLDPVNDHGPSARLSKWCGTGSLSWVFDNETDDLTFDSHTMFGFDVTDFLDNAEVRTLIVMYLFQRLEQLIDGRPLMIFMDEFWKLLLDESFEDFVQNKLKVIRKQNGILVLGTQSPKDVLRSPIAHSIIDSAYDITVTVDAQDVLKKHGLDNAEQHGLTGEVGELYDDGNNNTALWLGEAEKSLEQSQERFNELSVLVQKVDDSPDQKYILDLQARISAEAVLLQNELVKLQVMESKSLAAEAMYQKKVRQMAVESTGTIHTVEFEDFKW